MVSCRFSLKPIHWTLAGARPLSGHVACRNGTLWRKNLEELVVTGFTLKMCYPDIWRNSSSLKSQKKTCHVGIYYHDNNTVIIIIIEVIIIIDCHVDSFFLLDQSIQPPFLPRIEKSVAPSKLAGERLSGDPQPQWRPGRWSQRSFFLMVCHH